MKSCARNTIIGATLALLTAGCGDSKTSDTDAGVSDAGDTVDSPVTPDSGQPDLGSPPEMCSGAGAMEAVACGSCGLAQRTCGADLLWGPPGTCLGEGECAPGSIDDVRSETCERRQRICDADCSYRDWTVIEPAGDCTIGDTRSVEGSCPPGSAIEERCNDSCVWEATGACTSPCGEAPRATPSDAREVCVPAGPFVRGDPDNVTTTPVLTVEMSAYYIDVFPVTNRRYAACLAAGGCPVLSDALARDSLAGGFDDYPVENTSHNEAAAFCTWDGGRYLPSMAQWEKAGRGPAPRTNNYPWDTGTICEHVLSEACGWMRAPGVWRMGVPYDSLPETRGYYGTEVQVGGPPEWVRDRWFWGWHGDASSVGPDPVGTVGRPATMNPGRTLGLGNGLSIVSEMGWTPDDVGPSTFRCARPALTP